MTGHHKKKSVHYKSLMADAHTGEPSVDAGKQLHISARAIRKIMRYEPRGSNKIQKAVAEGLLRGDTTQSAIHLESVSTTMGRSKR